MMSQCPSLLWSVLLFVVIAWFAKPFVFIIVEPLPLSFSGYISCKPLQRRIRFSTVFYLSFLKYTRIYISKIHFQIGALSVEEPESAPQVDDNEGESDCDENISIQSEVHSPDNESPESELLNLTYEGETKVKPQVSDFYYFYQGNIGILKWLTPLFSTRNSLRGVILKKKLISFVWMKMTRAIHDVWVSRLFLKILLLLKKEDFCLKLWLLWVNYNFLKRIESF